MTWTAESFGSALDRGIPSVWKLARGSCEEDGGGDRLKQVEVLAPLGGVLGQEKRRRCDTYRLAPFRVKEGNGCHDRVKRFLLGRARVRKTGHSPTMMNSAGIQKRKKWNKVLSAGHPGVLRSLHVRGDRTRVSQAATVRVQTKKYFCALR